MHQYLEAIGFGKVISKAKLDQLVNHIEWNYTNHELIGVDREWDFCEFKKEFAPGIGMALCGYMDIDEMFTKEYYYPYFYGTGITSYSEVVVERRMDREDYVGICEDFKIGISLIFKLQNSVEYLREKDKGTKTIKYSSVTISGLCNEGTVLFPIKKTEEQRKSIKEESKNRMSLLNEARGGDSAAAESLTLEDMDVYSQVSKRLVSEDVLSIVDTYIMPYGIECDRYSIMGEIKAMQLVENEFSKAKLYILSLDVNGLNFDVCVPKDKLTGVPLVGRRFKGDVWLQGKIHFR